MIKITPISTNEKLRVMLTLENNLVANNNASSVIKEIYNEVQKAKEYVFLIFI
jgi:hypothetical protein